MLPDRRRCHTVVGSARPKTVTLHHIMKSFSQLFVALRATACLVLLGVLSMSLNAQERSEYRVEILVLRHLNNEARSFEAPVPEQLDNYSDASGEPATRDRPRRIRTRGVSWKEFILRNENSRLRRSRDFRPLIHVAWTQQALETSESGWVPVRGQANDGTSIDGLARLTVNRYLHLQLELDARIPEKGEFRLIESRRMKSGELHYFDHPEFGALVTIIPEPEATPEEGSAGE